ncbi:MAG: hypothetical protein F4Y00_05725 [Bacteroidetes bacterium SB0662_bin_6]|nr:hypothetical protein [Bacteroidetes bacterium SB0668_bin_1]MYE04455.1 hypothetical protein [Bacteroidetes bacterium SB0662_bin_6]
MPNGYSDSKPYDASNLEDEFLCEYVDGTMDPLVRHVFEEYVRANPGMEEHIERLRRTRRLLCRYACRCRAPSDLHDRLRNFIPAESSRPSVPSPVVSGEEAKGTVASSYAVTVILMLGLVLGASGVQSGNGRMPSSAMAGSHHVQHASSLPYTGEMMRRSSYSSVIHPLPHSPRRHHARSIVTAGIKRELRTRPTPAGSMVAEVVFP